MLMKEITITANDANQRLDRFLRKYLKNASLGQIYKIIRKDVKIDGKRRPEEYMLQEGEILTLYMSDDDFAKSIATSSGVSRGRAKKQFGIVYEDANILIADKPFGLLTHGDQHEKKNHLANQVKDYLIESGQFDPRNEKVFAPAPANRIDRNTTGVVVFGKTASALKTLNQMIREDMLDKYYLTVVHGIIDKEMVLEGSLLKDESKNKVKVGDEGLAIKTIVRSLRKFDNMTLVEVELVTGRSHQIRAHLASIGHPIIGDSKYQTKKVAGFNKKLEEKFGLSTQLLHAHRIVFRETTDELKYLKGKEFEAEIPDKFNKILKEI